MQLEQGTEFKQKYDIQETLGKGRFGIVHKVVDRKTNQIFAAKFIRCRSAKEKDKVKEEIDIMNQLRHEQLLQLAAAFDHPKEMIMVMELYVQFLNVLLSIIIFFYNYENVFVSLVFQVANYLSVWWPMTLLLRKKTVSSS